jgi:hypothetical protein
MTPERLKEIREILDDVQPYEEVSQDIVEELYDEVSSRMPVSVEEEPPEFCEEVLAWSPSCKRFAVVAMLEERWKDMENKVLYPRDHFSHWMHLPPPVTGVPQ